MCRNVLSDVWVGCDVQAMRTQLHLRPFGGALPVPLCAEDDVSYADWQQYFGEVSVVSM
jgi:hypothetical protein